MGRGSWRHTVVRVPGVVDGTLRPVEVPAQYVPERRTDVVAKEGELLRYLQTVFDDEARQGEA